LEREDGAAVTLRQLGAQVRTLDLWDDPINLLTDDDSDVEARPRALLFEALDRPDLAMAALSLSCQSRRQRTSGWQRGSLPSATSLPSTSFAVC
jgi:hypothetical protein